MRSRLYVFSILLTIIISCAQKEQKNNTLPNNTGIVSTKYVFLKDIVEENSKHILIADTIQYFTGASAQKAYKEDHAEEPEESTFYIRNTGVDNIKFPISNSAKIVTKTLENYKNGDSKEGTQLTIGNFKEFLNDSKYSYIKSLPFKISFSGKEITKIEEIYIP